MVLISVTPASAVTLADKRAQAVQVAKQVDSLDQKLSIADEEYNAAGVRLAGINHDISLNKAKLAKLRRRLSKVNGRLDNRAVDMYRSGPLGFFEVIAGANSFEEFAANWDLLTQMNQSDAAILKTVKHVRSQTRVARAVLANKRQAAEAQKKIRADAVAGYKQDVATKKKVLASVQADIKRLVIEQQRAAAAAAARALASRGGGYGGGNWPSPSIPAHGNVVDYARSRLGCPYVWAATGPGAFDCSGLAMWCYAQIGISLPHSSRDQINVGQRVSQKDLQPGDLVFFGSPIHHVGIYIGGGQMIEAPYTGASVRVAGAFRGDYAGACRP